MTTTKTQDEAISALNNLIETSRDGQNGFQSAAEGITDPSLKALFLEYALQRGQFVSELQSEVRALDGDPQTTGSVAGALHRGWINIKSAVTGKDEHAILEECERGEDSAKKNYLEALKENLPSNIQKMVNRQYQAVLNAHDTVRGWRDRTDTARSASA